MRKVILYFMSSIFFICLGFYIDVAQNLIYKYEIIEKYPTIVVGIAAAIAALLGVVISQYWQSVNTKKNIKADYYNLQLQLENQANNLDKQLVAQNNNLIEQLEHSKTLKDTELIAQRKYQLYEKFEEDKKETYFIAAALHGIIRDVMLYKSATSRTQIKLNISHKYIGKEVYNALMDTFLKQQKEYQQQHNTALEAYNESYSMLMYMKDTKGLASTEFEIFDLYLQNIIKMYDEFVGVVELSKEVKLILFDNNEREALFNDFDKKVSEITNKLFNIYSSNDFTVAYESFLKAIAKQKINYLHEELL